jgi:hypothetical protein
LDISVQAYIASCADARQADEIEGTLLTFDGIKQRLKLQNVSDVVGPVFPEEAPDTTNRAPKRASPETSGGAGSKRKVAHNTDPHQTLALTSYAEWDKARRFSDLLPKVGRVSVCGLFHCRQTCNSGCDNVHDKLSPTKVMEVERWINESKAKTSKGAT